MSRLPRLNLPNIPQHIIQRGNNRQVCFFYEDDYKVYLDKLKEYSLKYQVEIHSYVLMTNHIHLLLTPKDGNGVSRLIQTLSSYYVRYINKTYQRTGSLWEGRYKSSLVDSEHYFLLVSRYIELNPVRAGMVKHPAEYPWSSYQKNALGKPIKLVTPHACYKALGNTVKERQQRYESLFVNHIPNYTLNEIRDAVNKAWVLGDERFIQQIEQQTNRRARPAKHGGDRKSSDFKKKR